MCSYVINSTDIFLFPIMALLMALHQHMVGTCIFFSHNAVMIKFTVQLSFIIYILHTLPLHWTFMIYSLCTFINGGDAGKDGRRITKGKWNVSGSFRYDASVNNWGIVKIVDDRDRCMDGWMDEQTDRYIDRQMARHAPHPAQ